MVQLMLIASPPVQVPFIAFYRKEYVEPELNIKDLWKVWQWDEKVIVRVASFYRSSGSS